MATPMSVIFIPSPSTMRSTSLRDDRVGNNFLERPGAVNDGAGIRFCGGFANRAHDANWRRRGTRDVAGAARKQRPESVRHLPDGQIKLRLQSVVPFGAQAPVLDVTHNADNFRLDIQQPDVDALSDRIDVRKIFARKRSVDYRDGGRVFVITIVEETPALNRNAQDRKSTRLNSSHM